MLDCLIKRCIAIIKLKTVTFYYNPARWSGVIRSVVRRNLVSNLDAGCSYFGLSSVIKTCDKKVDNLTLDSA